MSVLSIVDSDRPRTDQSRLRHYADVLERSRLDLEAAWGHLPKEVAEALRPSCLEMQQRLAACMELALVAGYRSGLVDFYEDTPS